MSVIRWTHDGRQPIIPVRILVPIPPHDLTGIEAQALVDTGSTISGVSEGIATKLGLIERGKRPLASAHNEDQVERYIFRVAFESTVDEAVSYPYIFEPVVGFELRNGFRFDALLGMDILRQCDLTMNRNGQCELQFGRAGC